MKALRYITSLLVSVIMTCAYAQSTDRDCIRMGNRYYREGNISKAEIYYRKALEKKKTMEAYYNLGNALIMQSQDSTAFEMYKKALDFNTGNMTKKSHIYHNMGNIMYSNACAKMRSDSQGASQMFGQAAELYKSALRCNPNDDETRYNLAKALFQLKKNKDNSGGGGGGGNDDQKDKQNQQNKDKQDQQNQQNKQDQSQDNKDKKEEQQQNQRKQQQDQNKMSDEAAEQLLNSAQQDEQGVQRKLQRDNQSRRRQLEKDW